MVILFYFLAALIGYLLGCSSMAFYISKIKKTNIAEQGSKNLGTANTLKVCGAKASLLVLVHDLGKSAGAVLIAHYAFRQAEFAGIVAGVMSIVGHIFPFYLKFRGGKGYASYIGVMLAINWEYAIVSFAVTIIVTMITNYMIIGNAATIIPFPIFLAVTGNYIGAIIILLAAILVLFKHGSHFIALFKKQEPRFWQSLLSKNTDS